MVYWAANSSPCNAGPKMVRNGDPFQDFCTWDCECATQPVPCDSRYGIILPRLLVSRVNPGPRNSIGSEGVKRNPFMVTRKHGRQTPNVSWPVSVASVPLLLVLVCCCYCKNDVSTHGIVQKECTGIEPREELGPTSFGSRT